jgi:hypothetical protein
MGGSTFAQIEHERTHTCKLVRASLALFQTKIATHFAYSGGLRLFGFFGASDQNFPIVVGGKLLCFYIPCCMAFPELSVALTLCLTPLLCFYFRYYCFFFNVEDVNVWGKNCPL